MMTRFKLALLLVLFSQPVRAADELPPLPSTAPPRIGIATAKMIDSQVQLQLVLQRMVKESRTRIVGNSGKPIEETYIVEKPVYETHVMQVGTDVKVYDRGGTIVDPKTLPLLLEKETLMLLTVDGKLDPFYRRVFRDDILIVAWPERKEADNGRSYSPALPSPASR